MDQIKLQLARIQQQIGLLSASQKMLVAALLAVMVLTLMFWSRYAGTADMEAVLDQSLKTDEIARITAAVRSKGIDYRVVNDRILVPVDRKLEVLSDISFRKLVPMDTRGAYDEIIKRINPWSSQSDNDATRNEAKASYLAQVIRAFPGVSTADVIIDPTNEHRLGVAGRQPTASVLISTEDPTNKREDRKLVDSAASTVHGAQSGLEMKNINVVVNGVRYNVSDHDDMSISGGDEILTRQQEAEQSYVQKIQQQLSFAGSVLVTVSVDLNLKSEVRDEELYDAKGIISKEQQNSTETTEQTLPPPMSGEPGAQSNAPLAVSPTGPASASGGGSTHEHSSSTFQIFPSKTQLHSQTPAGKPTVLTAAVRVPRSYFVRRFHEKNGNASTASKAPDDNALQPIVVVETAALRNDVKKCTNITSDDNISVEPYSDENPLMAAGTTTVATASSTSGMSNAIGGHYKEIVIGVLAVVGLFMVSSIVKKTSPAPAVATAMELAEAPALPSGEDVAGDVSEGSSTLDGMELDDDAIKAQQMVEQVSTMVKENPDGAANLVKRWLNRS